MKYLSAEFQPDYQNIVDAALNKLPRRMPLYEHIINWPVIEHVLEQKKFALPAGLNDTEAAYYRMAGFNRIMGYDAVPFEVGSCSAFPGAGALGMHIKGVIQTMDDYQKYDWDAVPDRYMQIAAPHYEALRKTMPDGMKAIGAVGNGVFEVVQDLVGFMDLCLMKVDDPELYAMLFTKIGDIHCEIWSRVIDLYDDIFCVYRFGDDLGYKMQTMLSPDDVREHILPQYKRVISLIKRKSGKPFLLHSCGNLSEVMDDIIACGINAKHSNEDVIAPFSEYIRLYGDRIGLFGGIDTDVLCDISGVELRPYMDNIIKQTLGKPGFALGSGNSITAYISFDRYFTMNEMIRVARGE